MGAACCGESMAPRMPDIVCGLDDELFLSRPIRMATLGPVNQQASDVTNQLRHLYSTGENFLSSIRGVLGNPYPGRPKSEIQLKVWFLSAEPDIHCSDGERGPDGGDKMIELRGICCFATYGPAEAAPHEVTESILALQKKGRSVFKGSNMGEHIGRAFPGQKCVFKCWYSSS